MNEEHWSVLAQRKLRAVPEWRPSKLTLSSLAFAERHVLQRAMRERNLTPQTFDTAGLPMSASRPGSTVDDGIAVRTDDIIIVPRACGVVRARSAGQAGPARMTRPPCRPAMSFVCLQMALAASGRPIKAGALEVRAEQRRADQRGAGDTAFDEHGLAS